MSVIAGQNFDMSQIKVKLHSDLCTKKGTIKNHKNFAGQNK